MTNEHNLEALRLAIDLAKEALEAGDAPFGSVLVDADGKILQQDRNRTVTGEKGDHKADGTLHPEFTLAHWAQLNLNAEERAKTTVYTTGEHCAMCSAAHAWCGLGRIVYITSTAQYSGWMKEFGVPTNKVATLSIKDVAPGIPVEGPISGLDEEVRDLQRQRWERQGFTSKA